jgi:hypothetical protein
MTADDLSRALAFICMQQGPTDPASGLSRLDEAAYKVGDFSLTYRFNEGKHRGRPHCLVNLPNRLVAKLDIVTGEIIEGDVNGWGRSIAKFFEKYDKELLAIWEQTRPDDQRLPNEGPKK